MTWTTFKPSDVSNDPFVQKIRATLGLSGGSAAPAPAATPVDVSFTVNASAPAGSLPKIEGVKVVSGGFGVAFKVTKQTPDSDYDYTVTDALADEIKAAFEKAGYTNVEVYCDEE